MDITTIATPWMWGGFTLFVLAMLALDLGVFHRKAHVVTVREALMWSAIWIAMGLSFAVFVYFGYEHGWMGLGAVPDAVDGQINDGGSATLKYLTGYVVEKSLSVDNVFVIAMLFGFLAVPAMYQHRVLFWGIIGALLMRGIMIAIGAKLIAEFHWVLYVFGAFLILTAIKMAVIKGNDDPSQNIAVRLAKRYLPAVDFYEGQHFFTKRTQKPTYTRDPKSGRDVMDPPPPGTLSRRWSITPLFLTLLMVEVTDLVFAVDSIPAIFAITPDPFIVFTSNILAVLGLRALYFCLAVLIMRFRFLKPALVLILGYVGVKLLLLSVPPYLPVVGLEASAPIKISTAISMLVVLGTLAVATVLSIVFPKHEETEGARPV